MKVVPYTIVVDTREQLPLWTAQDVEVRKLDAGDYSIVGYEDKFAIERKSMADLVGTLTKGHERFKRELERAMSLDFFAIVVEESYTSLITNQWSGSVFTKMRGSQIAAIVNTLRVKYKLQIIFTNSRVEAKSQIKGMMSSYVRIQKEKK